jgi:hypothetical protein
MEPPVADSVARGRKQEGECAVAGWLQLATGKWQSGWVVGTKGRANADK